MLGHVQAQLAQYAQHVLRLALRRRDGIDVELDQVRLLDTLDREPALRRVLEPALDELALHGIKTEGDLRELLRAEQVAHLLVTRVVARVERAHVDPDRTAGEVSDVSAIGAQIPRDRVRLAAEVVQRRGPVESDGAVGGVDLVAFDAERGRGLESLEREEQEREHAGSPVAVRARVRSGSLRVGAGHHPMALRPIVMPWPQKRPFSFSIESSRPSNASRL